MLVQVYVPGGHKCVCECMTPILGATCMIPATSSRVYGVYNFSGVSIWFSSNCKDQAILNHNYC